MAIKARDQVTVVDMTDVDKVTTYYKLQLSTASAPAAPTTKDPTDWTTSEPAFTAGTTNTLYTCIRTLYKNGAFAWGAVSVSSSYEAAKAAYNAAQAAQSTANGKSTIFYGSTANYTPDNPVGNDLWMQTDQGNKFKIYDTTTHSWIDAKFGAAAVTITDLKAFGATIGGFTIGSTALYNGKSSLSAATNGVYVGKDGISCGSGSLFTVDNKGLMKVNKIDITAGIEMAKFYYDSDGNLTPVSGTALFNVNNNEFSWIDANNSNTWGCIYVGGTDSSSKLRGAVDLNLEAWSGDIVFKTNGSECMRIINGGQTRWANGYSNQGTTIGTTGIVYAYQGAQFGNYVESDTSGTGTKLNSAGTICSPKTYSATSTGTANVYITSNYNLTRHSSSSRRWKHDIENIGKNKILDPMKLYDCRVVQFKYNNDYLSNNDERYDTDIPGFIAEELDKVYPIAVDHKTENNITTCEDWNMRMLVPGMMYLIQDLNNRLKKLEVKK